MAKRGNQTRKNRNRSASSQGNELDLGRVPSPGARKSLSARTIAFIAIALATVSVIAGMWFQQKQDDVEADFEPQYVGRTSCIDCHKDQAKLFHGSHHDLAMDVANEITVLATFEGELEHHGVTSRFFRDGKKYMVETEGPSGQMEEFEVKYVFGVEPLQQYMVEFDRPKSMPESEVARLQVLRLCWDTKNNKWFFLDPPDVNEKLEPNDPLHWTGPAQCWNTSCAECHSTNLQKNFDPKTLVYHTTYSEIDVSCEACHGPGSEHVKTAQSKNPKWEREGTGLAKLKVQNNVAQIESCAPCHSRRRVLANGYHAGQSFDDFFQVELLYEQTYHADGQIKDEDYVYGSFIQSKMYHKNIKCTDCHDPHSTKVKFQNNQLCTSCHQHPASKYDSPAHHHHQEGSTGAACVNCHMPSTTYMAVDPRRDHSIRIPRPDLSTQHDLPNACSACHVDSQKLTVESRGKILQYQDWLRLSKEGVEDVATELARVDRQMADAFAKWYGERENDRPLSTALLESRAGKIQAVDLLKAVVENSQQPAIYRATGLMELNRFDTPEAYKVALDSLDDTESAVIAAALPRVERELNGILGRWGQAPPAQVAERLREPFEKLLPLIHHEQRVVRIEAARVIANIPLQFRRTLLSKDDRDALSRSLEELEAMYMVNNDRAMAYVALANLKEALGEPEAAKEALKKGIEVEPQSAGPRSNLATILEREVEELTNSARQLLTERKRDEYERTLADAEKIMWQVASLRAEELILLERDVERLPTVAALQYRYGLALHLAGESERSKAALLEAYRIEPSRSDYVLALALLYQRQENWLEAIKFARELVALVPDNPSYQLLLQQISQQAKAIRSNGPAVQQ